MAEYTPLQERLVLSLVNTANITEDAKELALEALCAMEDFDLKNEIEEFLDAHPRASSDEIMAFIRDFYPEYIVEDEDA